MENIPVKPAISENDVSKYKWYYSIEYSPGKFTKGLTFGNLVLTRKILENTEIKNMNCIDIGTMEAIVPVLLKRRGAKHVTAFDRFSYDNLPEKIRIVKQVYNQDFDFINEKQIAEIPGMYRETGKFPFDVTVFSGVLYHMFDPFGGLARVRGFTRNGGILILETAAIIDNSMVVHFNAEGRLHSSPTDYFMFSLGCLDYALRFLRLKALDCIYLKARKMDGLDVCRVCIPCRAVDDPLPIGDDQWMKYPVIMGRDRHQFDDFLDWEELKNDAPMVSYRGINRDHLVMWEETGAVDIYKTVVNSPKTYLDKNLTKLKLDDIY